MPVILGRVTDENGNPITGNALSHEELQLTSDEHGRLRVAPTKGNVIVSNSLVPSEYDRIELEYQDGEISLVRYLLSGEVVASISLSYLNGNLVSIERA